MNATSAFADIVRRELDGMQRLASILAEEFGTLGSTDPDALNAVLQRKAAILDELQRCAGERAAALQAAGVAASRAAIEDWLKAASSSNGLAMWNDLMARTREVHAHHQTNLALLEGLMRHNQQSLDLLTRLANPDLIYQSDGSTSGSLGTRSRGLA